MIRKISLFTLATWWITTPFAAHAQGAAAGQVRHPNVAVCTHFAQWWDVDALTPTLSKLGVGWVRDAIYWDEVEPKKGEYQVPAKTRKWVERMAKENIKVVATFAHGNPNYPNSFDPDAYAKAAAFLARELNGKIHAIEVFNEPNNQSAGLRKAYGGGWGGVEANGSLAPWVVKYVEFINKTAEAVKAVNPHMKVIGLGANPNTNFDEMILGISPKVDGVTFHPYSSRSIPEAMGKSEKPLSLAGIPADDKKYADVIATYGQGTFEGVIQATQKMADIASGPKEIWLTEWGFSTWVEGKGPNPGGFAGFTETAQAKYIQRRVMQCLGLGVTLSAIYDLMNDGTSRYEVEHNFGLLKKDLSPKPAFAAVQRLLAETADLKAKSDAIKVNVFPKDSRGSGAAERFPSPGTIQTYAFVDAAGNPAVAIWSVERANDLTPRLADVELVVDAATSRVTLSDLWTGEKSTPKTSGSGKRLMLEMLEIPDYPIVLRVLPKS